MGEMQRVHLMCSLLSEDCGAKLEAAVHLVHSASPQAFIVAGFDCDPADDLGRLKDVFSAALKSLRSGASGLLV